MSFKKSIIKDALIDAKEIENFAMNSAKKAMEESITPQIEEAVKNSIQQIETSASSEKNIKEGLEITITPETDLHINVTTDGAVPVVGAEEKGEEIVPVDSTSDELNPEEEMNNDEEIYEIAGISEFDMTEDSNAPVPPVGDVAPDLGGAPAAPAEGGEQGVEAKLDTMAQKIDSILAAVNPQAAQGEGEVEVVDDDAAAAGAPPAISNAPGGATAPAPTADNSVVSEDDIMFEISDDVMEGLSNIVTEDEFSLDEIEASQEALGQIEEIEIVDEDEELEEMRGMGNAVERSIANRENFIDKKKLAHQPVTVRENKNIKITNTKIKTHNESNTDGLVKENKSLKESVRKYEDKIKEFEKSFIELREHVQYMQVFNGKLAYANKLLAGGSHTADEKIRIAEAFDKAETVEEAKKLYNKLISESKAAKTSNPIENNLKSVKSTVQPSSKVDSGKNSTIYESTEMKRMKELAGLNVLKN